VFQNADQIVSGFEDLQEEMGRVLGLVTFYKQM
jgi:hypothetical protein